jgi:AcrR family transcriptional regulator
VAELLRERHASSLTMEAIAERLGMTKGNLYYYFRNKRELLYQCHLKGTNDSLRLLEEIAEVRASPGARLRQLITSLVLAVTRDTYGQVMTTDLESLSGPQRRHYVSLRDRFEQGVRRLVVEGMEQGEFHVRDAKLASFALLGAINSIGTWYDSAGASSPEEIAEQYAEFLIGGLQARPTASRHGAAKR